MIFWLLEKEPEYIRSGKHYTLYTTGSQGLAPMLKVLEGRSTSIPKTLPQVKYDFAATVS